MGQDLQRDRTGLTQFAAVDFESYFDDECSIRTLGPDGYIRHPKFEAYLVSIVTDDWEWVGDPVAAPWEKIKGWSWLAHYAGWDARVHHYLTKWGKLPNVQPKEWFCTADLCAFSAAPRALDNAAKYIFGEKISKDYRTLMKGKVFRDLSEENQTKVKEAALIDGRMCLRFWKHLSPAWPEDERRISRISREQAWHGLRLDQPALEADVKHLQNIVWLAEQMIPWHGVTKTMSYQSFVDECHKAGIEAPPSTAMTSDECESWEDTYGDQYPWVDAMRTARRANALLKKAQNMLSRIRPEDGRMPYENKYFGAHTGRWGDGGEKTGRYKSGGFNSRNLPRKEMFGEEYFLGKLRDDGTRELAEGRRFIRAWQPGCVGVNLRHRIIPAEGCHFPIADLTSIEPRVLWKLAGDEKSLAMAAKGMHPYEIHARDSMGYTEDIPLKQNKKFASKYQLSKARVLALGYQAGWVKFIMMAPTYIPQKECDRIFSAPVSEKDVTRFTDYLTKVKMASWNALWGKGSVADRIKYVNSWLIVTDFREKNPKIPAQWDKYKRLLQASIGEDMEIELPSGRSLIYRNIAKEDGEIKGTIIRDGKPVRVRLYGGKIVENITQAIARDIFVSCLLKLDDAALLVAMHSHDEAVPEVLLSDTAEEEEKIMSVPPAWMPDIPLASDCSSFMHYTKA